MMGLIRLVLVLGSDGVSDDAATSPHLTDAEATEDLDSHDGSLGDVLVGELTGVLENLDELLGLSLGGVDNLGVGRDLSQPELNALGTDVLRTRGKEIGKQKKVR